MADLGLNESAAKKLASEHMYTYSQDYEEGRDTSVAAYKALFPGTFTKDKFSLFKKTCQGLGESLLGETLLVIKSVNPHNNYKTRSPKNNYLQKILLAKFA